MSASRYRQGKYTAFEEPYYTQLQQWGIDSEDSEAQELLLTALEARHQLEWHWTRNRVQELTLQSLNLS